MKNVINIPGRLVIYLCIFGLFLVSGCEKSSSNEGVVLPFYKEASFTPHWFADRSEVPNDFHKIPSFSFYNQDGQLVTEESLEGKLYVANFFFAACPGICPMTMANMGRLQQAFADDENVMLLSHSVTPEKDSVEALKVFAEQTRVLSSKWYLVTGAREQIYNLGKNFYFAEEDLGEQVLDETRDEAFLHTESFFLIDEDRHIRGVYNGMNTASVTQLMEDVRTLQQEKRL
jgi:protein SCO1/2